MKVKYIDPPSGWKYGFPKIYKPLDGETYDNYLRRHGYPDDLIPIALKYSWTWEEDDNQTDQTNL